MRARQRGPATINVTLIMVTNRYYRNQWIPYLFLDEEVVEGLVDGRIVLRLDRLEVRLHQRQVLLCNG